MCSDLKYVSWDETNMNVHACQLVTIIVLCNIMYPLFFCRSGVRLNHYSKKPPYCWRLFALSLALISRGSGSKAAAGQNMQTLPNIMKYILMCSILYLNNKCFLLCLQVTTYLHKDYNNLWLVHKRDSNNCEEMEFSYCSVRPITYIYYRVT